MLICIAALAVWALALVWFVMFGHHNEARRPDYAVISPDNRNGSPTAGQAGVCARDKSAGGGTLCTEEILKSFDNTSLPAEIIDEIKREFREHFGERVPADVVRRLVEEYEESFGPIGLKPPDGSDTCE